MIRKALFAALASSICLGSASAQDAGYDDRFYIAPYLGVVVVDDDRRADDNTGLFGFGVGRHFSPNFAVEADVNRYSADLENFNGKWQVTTLGVAGRWFFTESELRPFGVLGAGFTRSRITNFNSDNSWEVKAGLGLQPALSENVSARFEALVRHINDDDTGFANESFTDFGLNIGLVFALGDYAGGAKVTEEAESLGEPRVEPTPEPTPVPKSNDDDKDGVPNEIDKCPDTAAGQMVSKDGCPVQEVIDLRGVNFDFDKCNLRPDAVTILNNAVEVLNAHSIVVSVEGHTDSRGTEAYNQKLSECRANVVKEYLQNNGVSQDKISGSVGFGESRPIDTSETEEGHAQNRRTELVRKN